MKLKPHKNILYYLAADPSDPMQYYKCFYHAKFNEQIPFIESKELIRSDGIKCKAYMIEEER